MTSRRPHRIGWLLAIPVLVSLAGCQTVPETGRSRLLLLSEAEEVRMGAAAYQEVLKKAKLSADPAVTSLVERVGRRIAAVTGKDYRWEFKVIEDPRMVNAFALPGGKVAVYTGMLPITQDDAGLATVLGHEIGHAVARHGGERVSQGILLELGAVGLSVALGRGDPRTVRAIQEAYGISTGVGVVLPFSRAQESEADYLGLRYMAQAGYDPRAALAFWRRMEARGDREKAPPEFLSTHPSAGRRLQQIEGWLPEVLPLYESARGEKR